MIEYRYKYKAVEYTFDGNHLVIQFYSKYNLKWSEKLTKKDYYRMLESLNKMKPTKVKSLQMTYVNDFVNIRAKKKDKFMSMMFPLYSFKRYFELAGGMIF